MKKYELNIAPEIIETIKTKTEFTIPARSIEVVSDICEYFKSENITISKEDLINGRYAEFNIEIRNKLLVYFYWMHNRNLKANNQDFVPLRLDHQHLRIETSHENNFLRSYYFTHPTPCPMCGTRVDLKFKNLKIIEVVETECPRCKHLISSVINAKCTCTFCERVINEVQFYFNNLPQLIENTAQHELNELNKLPINNLSDKRLKWFASKYSSDLSKDEREAISFNPEDLGELYEIFGKRAQSIVQKLKEKKVVYENLELKNKDAIVFEIKKKLNCFLGFESIHSSGTGRIDFSLINLLNAKISYLKVQEERLGSSPRKFIEVVFENTSFEFVPNGEYSNGKSWARDLHKAQIKLFSSILPQYLYLNDDTFYNKTDELNPYFFNYEEIDEIPHYNENHIKRLFRSNAEKNKFHFLQNNFRNHAIMVNVRLADLIDINVIRSFYSNEELKYLQNCILDFVIYSEDGFPLKVVELQRGEHHNTEEYIIKDRLKKSAIKRIGIIYEETF